MTLFTFLVGIHGKQYADDILHTELIIIIMNIPETGKLTTGYETNFYNTKTVLLF